MFETYVSCRHKHISRIEARPVSELWLWVFHFALELRSSSIDKHDAPLPPPPPPPLSSPPPPTPAARFPRALVVEAELGAGEAAVVETSALRLASSSRPAIGVASSSPSSAAAAAVWRGPRLRPPRPRPRPLPRLDPCPLPRPPSASPGSCPDPTPRRAPLSDESADELALDNAEPTAGVLAARPWASPLLTLELELALEPSVVSMATVSLSERSGLSV